MSGRVFVRKRHLWVAWYSTRRGRRYWFQVMPERTYCGWHLGLGLFRLYVGIGPGVPTP